MKRILIALAALAALVCLAAAQTVTPADPPSVEPMTPTILWPAPGPIRYPAPLGPLQLNASSPGVPGKFTYDPPAGTVLKVGDGQVLSVTFTPEDSKYFTAATATVAVDVIPTYWPYDPSEPAFVCHMNADLQTVVIDTATKLPRCFIVPVAVNVAITKGMLAQTAGMKDGKPAYKYASWWDYIIKFFLNSLVVPALDKYPPEAINEAKANAEAAARAVDAAKAALIGVDPTVLQDAPPAP